MKFKRPVWTKDSKAVIEIRGKNYSIDVDIIWGDDGIPDKAKILEFYETTAPLSDGRGSYTKWGGSPDFRQDEYYPYSDDGRAYDFLCTVYTNWADMGNCNIFVLFGETHDKVLYIEDVYMEASCS